MRSPGRMANKLKTIRQRLDEIDNRILDALAERQAVVRQVADHKLSSGEELRDLMREQHQLTLLGEKAQVRGLDRYFVTRVFHQILDHSVRFQQAHLTRGNGEPEGGDVRRVVVAYQGRAGAYSQMAAEQHFGPQGVELSTRGYDSFAGILEAVADRHADYAMLPVENTTAGSINEAYDLLGRMDLTVIGEEVLRVQHCLVGLPGSSLEEIKRVYSHPQGLLQCSNFLSTLQGAEVQAFTDTAMSVVKVRDEQNPSQAAVASERAASLYQLEVLARDIANQKDNYTRFMVVAREPITYDLRIPCKTSLIFATAHAEGALLRCLDQLAKRGLNLTKLESRPRPGVAWEYLFYVDFEGNLTEPNVQNALAELAHHTSFLKVLGSYPARTTREAMPAQHQRALQGRSTIAHGDADTVAVQPVAVGTSIIGGERPVLIAGPPAAEGQAMLQTCAQWAHGVGADVLRAPCFLPPTTAGGYEGPGEAGLRFIGEVGQALGLPVMTNVRDPKLVAQAAKVAALLEVDADQMDNFALLEQLGKVDRPVVLRRAPDATLARWLTAADHIASFGNRQVILCESGAQGAGVRMIDVAAIAQLRDQPRPILADPSCSASPGAHWGPLGRACLHAGAHGLILTIHPDPKKMRAPATAALDGPTFERLVNSELLG